MRCGYLARMIPGRAATLSRAPPTRFVTTAACCEEFQGASRLEDLVSAVRSCASPRDLARGRKIHEWIVKTGGASNIYVANLLMLMYGKCGSPEEALTIFNAICRPNKFSWKILLQVYVDNSMISEAEVVMENMPVEIRDFDLIAWNAMLTAYARHGHLDRALQLFHGMAHRTVVSWNSLLVAHIQAVHLDAAWETYGKMPQHGAVSGTAMLSAYGRDGYGTAAEARAVFDGLRDRDVLTWTALVASYGGYGMAGEALAAFHTMPAWSSVTCTAATVAVADGCRAGDARDLVRTLPAHNLVTYSHLVKTYGRLGSLEEAKSLFDGMPERDLQCWNVFLAAIAEAELVEDARAVFERMPQWSAVSFAALLQVLAQSGCVEELKRLRDEIPEADLVTSSMLLKGLAQHGRVEDARAALDRMPQHDTFSWNIVLGGIVRGGGNWRGWFDRIPHRNEFSWSTVIRDAEASAAEIMFDAMPQWDAVSCGAMISALASVGIERAKALFDAMLQRGADMWSTMFLAFAENGFVEEAEDFFDKLPQRSLGAWTAMISAFARSGHIARAKSLFDRIPGFSTATSNAVLEILGEEEAKDHFDRMPQRDAASWCLMMASCAGSFEAARKVFDRAPQWDASSFAAMIQELCQSEKIEQSRSFLLEIPEWSSMLCNLVILALMRKGLLEESREIFDAIEDKAPSLWAMIMGYAHNGHTTEAVALFRRHAEAADTLAWNAMIALHADRGDAIRATAIAHLMDLQGIARDELTFTTILASCARSGTVALAWECFTAMIGDYEARPSETHYRVVLDLVARMGMLDRAQDLLQEMPFSPDLVAWRTLLSASVVHHDASAASRAAEEMAELDLSSASLYVMLSRPILNQM